MTSGVAMSEPAVLPGAVARGALLRARAAQPAWAARPLRERIAILDRFHALLVERRERVVDAISRENGKPRVEGTVEVALVLDFARFYGRVAPRELGPRSFTPRNPALWRKRVIITREPLGVVGVISPWNYPLMLPAGPVIAALVSGNAVILKPSELTPRTADHLAELLHEAGVPGDVLQLLHGAGDAGAALVDAGCDKIFFTGSQAVGAKIAASCGARMIPFSLELGGSDPAVVLEDVDVAMAARGIAWGRFHNAGQVCVSPKRVIVVGSAYEPFLERIAEEARKIVVGRNSDGDMGCLITGRQHSLIDAMLRDAVEHGAVVVARGDAPGDERYFPPTVIAGVTDEMKVMQEESFGPLLPVVKASSTEDAIAIANRTGFGLAASVWGRDRRLTRHVASRLEAGSVAINDVGVTAGVAEAPHGGVKGSGIGRMHGVEGLHECTNTKTVVEERLPWLGQPWWHRYNEDVNAGMDHFVDMAHGRSLVARLRGLWGTRRVLRKRNR